MAVTTVAQLAAELNRSATALLEQLHAAGVSKASADDALTEGDKERLLDHLRTVHGTTPSSERKKITLTRKSTSEIKQADASGRARTIQVEVRKKRTFIQRDEPGAVPEPQDSDAELQRRQEEAQAQAEMLRKQEEELEARRVAREEQARLEREAEAERQRQAAEAAAALARQRAEEEARRISEAARASSKAVVSDGAPAPEPVAAPAAAPAQPAEPAKPALRVIKAADVVDEEKQRAAELAKRRKAAEDEAAAIRAMMNAPKKVMVAKKPEEPAKVEPAKEGIKGTIHKPAAAPGAAPGAVAKPGDKKIRQVGKAFIQLGRRRRQEARCGQGSLRWPCGTGRAHGLESAARGRSSFGSQRIVSILLHCSGRAAGARSSCA